MASNIQPRGSKFQLRVTHKLLAKTFFYTFDSNTDAENYRDGLLAALSAGVVPVELLATKEVGEDPTLSTVIELYQRKTSVTESDEDLFKVIRPEVGSVRMSEMTFIWAECCRQPKTDHLNA